MCKKILFSFVFLTTTILQAQTWGFTIGNFSFFESNPNNNCYNKNYYPNPMVSYVPQNVYMRPYQYMPAPQPIIITPPPVYYNRIEVPRYYNRCYNSRW